MVLGIIFDSVKDLSLNFSIEYKYFICYNKIQSNFLTLHKIY